MNTLHRAQSLICSRHQVWLACYGSPLTTGISNGAIAEALEAIADAAIYLRQAIDDRHPNTPRKAPYLQVISDLVIAADHDNSMPVTDELTGSYVQCLTLLLTLLSAHGVQ